MRIDDNTHSIMVVVGTRRRFARLHTDGVALTGSGACHGQRGRLLQIRVVRTCNDGVVDMWVHNEERATATTYSEGQWHVMDLHMSVQGR